MTVVVTRARAQASKLAAKLRALGAHVIELPAIAFEPPSDPGPLDEAIARIDAYDWIIFTSINGVEFFFRRLRELPRRLEALRAKLCAIGPATRAALEATGQRVDLMPEEYVAESVLAAFAGIDLAGKRILLPRAAVARDVIPTELRRRGAEVDVVEAYRTVIPDESRALARDVFAAANKPDWVTFTSSSTVRNFVALAGQHTLEGVRIASIGPVTSATIREFGLKVDVEASPYTIDGLVEAIRGTGGSPLTLPQPARDRSG